MINLVEDIKPVSWVKSHTAQILKQVEEKSHPVVITQNGEAKAVLLDVKQYQKIVDSMNLLKILAIGENDIQNNRVYTHEKLQEKITGILEE